MLVILPHQLFDIKHVKKLLNESIKTIVIYEHHKYFTNYRFNKKKLILHRASMKYYYDYLKSNLKSDKDKIDIKYIQFNEPGKFNSLINGHLNINNTIHMFDPIDKIKLRLGKDTPVKLYESPNFLIPKELIEKYRKKTDKFTFNNYYLWAKKEINLYPELKSMDKDNRDKINKDVKIPPTPSSNIKSINFSGKQSKYLDEAIKYIDREFKSNYGNSNKTEFIYPIDHETASKWLTNFLKNKLDKFGPYQDYVKKDNGFLFHSILSSSINIGLLNPIDIINELVKYKSKVRLNSFEGFLRQLFWREYQRYTYIHIDYFKRDKNLNPINLNHNYFGNRGKLNKSWYNGSLGFEPINKMIIHGFQTGYLHHICRLMWIGNFMNINGISPMEGFKWFMEFSIDSYEWVMCQNVLDMVFFCTGGMTMRKPYISSSNYPLKMSEYVRSEDEDGWDKWDVLYNTFLKNNKKKLYKFRYHFPGL